MQTSDMAGILGLLLGGAGGYYGGQKRADREKEMLEMLYGDKDEDQEETAEILQSNIRPSAYEIEMGNILNEAHPGREVGPSPMAAALDSIDLLKDMDYTRGSFEKNDGTLGYTGFPTGTLASDISNKLFPLNNGGFNNGGSVRQEGNNGGLFRNKEGDLKPGSSGFLAEMLFELQNAGIGLGDILAQSQGYTGLFNEGGRVGLANGGNPYAGLGYSPVNNIFRMDGINTGTVAPGASSGFQSFEDGITEQSIPETSLLPNPMQTPFPINPMYGGPGGDGDPRRNPTPMSAEDAGYSYSGDPSLGGSATFNNPDYGVLGDTFTPARGIGLADDQYGRTRNIGIPEDLGLNLYDAAYPVSNAISNVVSNPLSVLGALAGIPGLGMLSGLGAEEEAPDYGPVQSINDMPDIADIADIANSITPMRRPTQPLEEAYSVGYGLGQVDPRLAAALESKKAATLEEEVQANAQKRRMQQTIAEAEAAARRQMPGPMSSYEGSSALGNTRDPGDFSRVSNSMQGPSFDDSAVGRGDSGAQTQAAANAAARAQAAAQAQAAANAAAAANMEAQRGRSRRSGRDFGGPSGHGSGRQGGQHGPAGGQGGRNRGTSRF